MKRFVMLAVVVMGPISWAQTQDSSTSTNSTSHPGQHEPPRKIEVPQSAAPAPAQTFASETSGKNRLASLRLYKAAQQGKTAIESCPDMTGTPPLPTLRDFQSYYDPFGANFDVGASFGDTGANGIPSAQTSIQTEALGRIEFESEHFFYNYGSCLSHRPTVSFGGTVGLQPALVMENLTSPTAVIANPNNRPMFQDAFVWTLGPKLNVATSHLSQLALFANLGQKYIISQVTSFKQGDDTITATPVSNGVGQSALFWETGL